MADNNKHSPTLDVDFSAKSKGGTQAKAGGLPRKTPAGKWSSSRSSSGSSVPSMAEYEQSAPQTDKSRGASGYWLDRADTTISNGLGANNTYEDKAGQFITQNPYTAPDYQRNWVNDGQPLDFANRHGTAVTNEWARGAEALNNTRHWNPGTAGELGTIGGSGSTSGTIGEVGHGERWEPIDTQELRAHKRAEDREADVMQRGIARQDMYAQYPYDMSVAHQKAQMENDYGIDMYKAKSFADYGMLIQKASDASSATGIYARALWGLAGIGGYILNPFDTLAYNQMAAAVNSGGSVEQIRKKCEQILLESFRYKLNATGQSATEVMRFMRNRMGDVAFGDLMSLLGGSMFGIYNPNVHGGQQ